MILARPGSDDGSALTVVAVALAALALVGLVLVDVAVLLHGYSAAAGTADAAALAAAAAAAPDDPDRPDAAASTVATAGGARLHDCHCRGPVVEVTIARPVDTLLLAWLGIVEVTATARATLVREP